MQGEMDTFNLERETNKEFQFKKNFKGKNRYLR